MKLNKISKIGIFVFIALLFLIWGGVEINKKIEWRMTQNLMAGSAYPVEMGLMQAVLVQCVTTGYPPVCTGGTLCNTLDAGRCTTYNDVSGTPSVAVNGEMVPADVVLASSDRFSEDAVRLAQAMPANALFSVQNIAMAGLTAGADLIAGGMAPTMMDAGPLASWGGCANCAKTDSFFGQLKEKFKVFAAMVMGR